MKKSEQIIGSDFRYLTETQVDQLKTIKNKFRELVDIIDSFEGCERRKAISYTNLETAQMYAVKAITNK